MKASRKRGIACNSCVFCRSHALCIYNIHIYIYIYLFFWIYETINEYATCMSSLRSASLCGSSHPTFSPARMGDKFEMRSSRDGSDEMITHCEAVGKSCTKDLRNASWKGAGVKAIDWNWWNLFFRFLMTCFCWSFFYILLKLVQLGVFGTAMLIRRNCGS